ncbi:hypothetical protein DAEQUDRAFT_492360 [Daedalea quercina L-15889]|uniref:Uncharacterized protein n=1 Tax=Daedalea quercina L-15889 TaxID=1314783 RepID=A0A165MPX6_9APHY|nr:hypothetical protein DAEQUDRAFT_492360 [Daedalea quercina L-15889]
MQSTRVLGGSQDSRGTYATIRVALLCFFLSSTRAWHCCMASSNILLQYFLGTRMRASLPKKANMTEALPSAAKGS